jgi:starvation-inducible outer membrane lipoprotein
MNKMILIAVLAVTLTGCGWYERKVVANITGYSKTCVEGVTYLQFSSGATPQVNLEGLPVACN